MFLVQKSRKFLRSLFGNASIRATSNVFTGRVFREGRQRLNCHFCRIHGDKCVAWNRPFEKHDRTFCNSRSFRLRAPRIFFMRDPRRLDMAASKEDIADFLKGPLVSWVSASRLVPKRLAHRSLSFAAGHLRQEAGNAASVRGVLRRDIHCRSSAANRPAALAPRTDVGEPAGVQYWDREGENIPRHH